MADPTAIAADPDAALVGRYGPVMPRIALRRARSRVRAALEAYLEPA